jgi:heme-degrading monooxygenase HmoA
MIHHFYSPSEPMIAVIFEVTPKPESTATYFDIAAELRETLQTIDGFISVERFESLTTRGKFLSLSFWRDEEAARQWRTTSQHRAAQARGRAEVFADYRIRVAHVVRDYGRDAREEVPQDSKHFHTPL